MQPPNFKTVTFFRALMSKPCLWKPVHHPLLQSTHGKRLIQWIASLMVQKCWTLKTTIQQNQKQSNLCRDHYNRQHFYMLPKSMMGNLHPQILNSSGLNLDQYTLYRVEFNTGGSTLLNNSNINRHVTQSEVRITLLLSCIQPQSSVKWS